MRFEIVTIFPEFFAGPLDYGIVRRAREAGLVDVRVHDLRAFAHDRHRTVDDRPFGGGEGMVLKPEPIFDAVETISDADSGSKSRTAVALLSASGKLFRQDTARGFSQLERIVLLCGRYEGVDERVAEHLATHEVSIGDFVLSGGELGAALIVDAVTRLIPGALGNEDSTVNESFGVLDPSLLEDAAAAGHQPLVTSHPSFAGGEPRASEPRPSSYVLLDYPHYTRPAEFRGWNVPEVLLSGNHEEIRRWRVQKAIEKTRRNRPDLLLRASSLQER